MPNLNTFSDALYQFNNSQPSTVILNAVGSATFSTGPDAIAVVAAAQIAPIYGPAFKTRPLAGTPFRVKAGGTFSVNGGTNVALTLNLITPVGTPGLAMASVGNTNVPSGLQPSMWWLECTFMWDGSKFVSGTYSGFFGNHGAVGPTESFSGATVTSAPLIFQVQASVNSGNPVNNQFTLTEFSADLI